ncbi:hypothetical protein CAPTEDRAFT_124803, partial [Capitella teleta]
DCEVENGGCQHQCTEEEIDEWCSCNNGFEIPDEDWRNCIDIDECERGMYEVDCHICVNLIGGFTCLCNDTYVLDPNNNNKTCIGQSGQYQTSL